MGVALEELVQTLLYEGYALYPYTPGATKNATPTPFGIVYPPAYAEATASTFDKLRMQGIAHADGDAVLAGEVRFLHGAGTGHQAVPRRLEAPGRPLGATWWSVTTPLTSTSGTPETTTTMLTLAGGSNNPDRSSR